MAVRTTCVFVLALAVTALASDSWDNVGVRIALKVYDECSKSDGFSPCLKKKAVTFLDRLGRMEKFSISEGIIVVRASDIPTVESIVTEEQLENSLPRSLEERSAALDGILLDKVTSFVGSRTLQITMPKLSLNDFSLEEGRGKKMKGMMGGMMMGIAAKLAALVPVAIAGLFLLAGKALITAKIALLLAGIIAIKKLVASKQGGGGGHGGWQPSGGGGGGGGGGGWHSSGGGWDKRSIDEAQKLAYKAYAKKPVPA